MKTFLFDLDGTLLPMNQDKFVKVYFEELVKKFAVLGYEGDKVIKAVWSGISAMIKNDGSMTNEECFQKCFAYCLGNQVMEQMDFFIDFYRNEFAIAKSQTWLSTYAAEDVKILKEKGYRLVAATNPVFPQVATYTRLDWAGLKPDDFELITTYENSHFCKPNLEYYQEILSKIGEKAENCIMVGNDVKEDMCVSELGMETFLIEDCMLNTDNLPIKAGHRGSFKDFDEFVRSLNPATIE